MSERSGKVSSGGTVNGPGLFTYDRAGGKLPSTWFVENDYINFEIPQCLFFYTSLTEEDPVPPAGTRCFLISVEFLESKPDLLHYLLTALFTSVLQ